MIGFQELGRALRNRAVAGITCRGKTDGGGAQIQAVMSTQIFARAIGMRYFHTPLSDVAHVEGSPLEWAAKWDDCFALGAGHDLASEAGSVVSVERFLEGYSGPPPIVAVRHVHDFCDDDPDRYRSLASEFRARCRLVDLEHGPDFIAAHIRRGDVAEPGSRYADRLTPIASVARTLSLIHAIFPNLEIQVFSQGPASDFAELPEGCSLHLDLDVFETMHRLINASVLVTAKSSFSYVAAVLSAGTVLYEPFWHRPMSHWFERKGDGSIDRRALRDLVHSKFRGQAPVAARSFLNQMRARDR